MNFDAATATVLELTFENLRKINLITRASRKGAPVVLLDENTGERARGTIGLLFNEDGTAEGDIRAMSANITLEDGRTDTISVRDLVDALGDTLFILARV